MNKHKQIEQVVYRLWLVLCSRLDQRCCLRCHSAAAAVPASLPSRSNESTRHPSCLPQHRL